MHVDHPDFQMLVDRYYEPLYRFALSLSRREADACDLTQQTFYLWATKGHQLRDGSRVKSWLFTTLHRAFLGSRRRESKFPHYELETAAPELPAVTPNIVNELDSGLVKDALLQVDDLYRAPLMLFYMQQHSYKEIAELLEIPIGTVMSRLSRGKEQIRQILSVAMDGADKKIISLPNPSSTRQNQNG